MSRFVRLALLAGVLLPLGSGFGVMTKQSVVVRPHQPRWIHTCAVMATTTSSAYTSQTRRSGHSIITTSTTCRTLANEGLDDTADNHTNQDATTTTTATIMTRRRALLQSSVVAMMVAVVASMRAPPATAKDDDVVVAVDPAEIKAAFDAVRQQLTDRSGGVAYMQSCIDNNDFVTLMEYTKTYDQVLRKGVMGKAKKYITNKNDQDKAVLYANGVTFDLIGMNRSSRPGQENAQLANKYLQELRDDVSKFIELQPNV